MTEAPPGVEQIRLTRPHKRNALDVAACEQLVAALDLDPPPGRRCYLLSGEGDAFCAGADFGEISPGVGEGDFGAAVGALYRRMAEQPLPVVAWVNGPALGAGCILALMCDLRVVAPNARMGIPASRLGLALGPGIVQRLAAEVGTSVTRLLLLTGRPLDCADLLRLGVGHALAETYDTALRWAGDLAAAAPLSVRAHRRALQGRSDDAAQLVAAADASLDLAEGLTAVRERRPPQFEGR